MSYEVQLVWNREFHWGTREHRDDLDEAIREAKSLLNMGDGASVKKTRVVDDGGKVVWWNGKKE